MRKVLSGLALAFVVGGVANAGQKLVSPVVVTHNSDSSGWMKGSLGATRNSADTISYLKCQATRYASGTPFVSCNGYSANRITGYCYSTSTQLLAAVEGIASDSYIEVFWNTSGQCTSIDVEHDSRDEPKQ